MLRPANLQRDELHVRSGAGLPGPDADACTIRAQRLAMRQALSLGARHQSGSGGSGSASMTVEGSGRQGSGSRKRSTVGTSSFM